MVVSSAGPLTAAGRDHRARVDPAPKRAGSPRDRCPGPAAALCRRTTASVRHQSNPLLARIEDLHIVVDLEPHQIFAEHERVAVGGPRAREHFHRRHVVRLILPTRLAATKDLHHFPGHQLHHSHSVPVTAGIRQASFRQQSHPSATQVAARSQSSYSRCHP